MGGFIDLNELRLKGVALKRAQFQFAQEKKAALEAEEEKRKRKEEERKREREAKQAGGSKHPYDL
jgi:hypothetical protein